MDEGQCGFDVNAKFPGAVPAMQKTVLIVEDNELNMKLFNDLLEAHGYRTLQSTNGMEAMELARSHRPDVILMDEWIAVGDADFQKIAHKRILELMERAGILVLASHDLELIRLYCNKVMRIESGVASPIMDVKKLDELLAAA